LEGWEGEGWGVGEDGSGTAVSADYSTYRVLPTMNKFRLTKISSFALGAEALLYGSGFACLEPRKRCATANFYPGIQAEFCRLGVQLFQIGQQWSGKPFDNGP
jgi:hypothetical protein